MIDILILSLISGMIGAGLSRLISQSEVFSIFREYFDKYGQIGKMINCSYCCGHYTTIIPIVILYFIFSLSMMEWMVIYLLSLYIMSLAVYIANYLEIV